MDELTLSPELSLFREFRSDTPGPSAAQAEAARARLLDAMTAEGTAAARRASSRRRGWLGHFTRTRFWAPVAAAAAVTAVAITVALVAAPGSGSSPKPSPAATHRAPQPRHQKSRSSHRAHGTSDASAGQEPARAGEGTTAPGARAASPGVPGSPTASGATTPTTITLGVTPVLGNGEQPVKLQVGVTDHSGDNLTGGTVTIYIEPQPTGSQAAPASVTPVCVDVLLTYNDSFNNNGSCYYTPTKGETAQTDLFVAEYSGYGPYERSGSNSATLDVPSAADPVTNLSASVSGLTVTMTATVTDPAGDNLSSGTVDFTATPDVVGELGYGCSAAPLTYDPTTQVNTATCTYTLPTAGPYVLWAGFSGALGYPGSYSYFVDITAGG
jgi:hypothetical protein